MKYTPELYVKGPEEMWDLFGADEYNNDGYGEAGARRCSTRSDRRPVRRRAPIGANHAPVVVIVKSPPKSKMPKHADKAYGGDLTAWYTDFCSRFELEPATDPGIEQARAQEGLRQGAAPACEAGMVWRYGPGITKHRHETHPGTDEFEDAVKKAATPTRSRSGRGSTAS
jgi:hypothetical protein